MSKNEKIVIDSNLDFAEICTRVSAIPDSIVTLEIEGRGMLHSSFGLRLLQARFPQKKFQLVSSDSALKRIAEPLGIRVYAKAESIEFEQEYSKTHILRHNFTFFEYFWYEIRKMVSRVRFTLQKKKATTLKYRQGWLVETNLLLLVTGLILSISLLFFIFYFAVSKTTVTITPDFAIKTVSQNLIYSEVENQSVLDARPIVPVRRVEKTTTIEETYNIASYDLGSVRAAKGEVEIYNEMTNEQVFRPNTRFVTEEGLVFRTQSWVKVPPMRTLSGELVIGKAPALLIADGYDTKGELIGVKGNIPEGTLLDIPGLKFNRDKLYAKSTQAFTGGQNPTVRIVTQEELDKFTALLTDRLKTQALADMKHSLETENEASNKNFMILEVSDNIRYSDPKIEILDAAKVGDRRTEVRMKGSVTVTSFVYDRNTVLALLKNLLGERLLYGTERLHDVLSDSLKITSTLNRVDAPKFTLKGTTELSATISYNFEDDANAQTRRLKNLIAGQPTDQAVSVLLNDQSIAKAKIRLSPFWLTRVSSNVDNIEFLIEK
jgi:hypothetical protein